VIVGFPRQRPGISQRLNASLLHPPPFALSRSSKVFASCAILRLVEGIHLLPPQEPVGRSASHLFCLFLRLLGWNLFPPPPQNPLTLQLTFRPHHHHYRSECRKSVQAHRPHLVLKLVLTTSPHTNRTSTGIAIIELLPRRSLPILRTFHRLVALSFHHLQ